MPHKILHDLRALCATAALLAGASSLVAAQTGPGQDTLVYLIDPVVVTATRGPRELSRIPQPMSVVQLRAVQRRQPNTVSDLLRTLPGVDVTGVGVNQGRPQIRGLKGQRILLLADGLRLNNSRRQQDFGELPAIVDVNGVERVEVLRGPSSVLYGSDAIGGVVNVITRAPTQEGTHGTGTLRYGSVEEQYAGTFRAYGRYGGFNFRAGGAVREASAYQAPAGTYGDITLAQDAVVDGTGTKDRNMDARVGYEAGDQSVFAKFERYDADDSGFGSVNPALYAPMETEVRITYPMQTFNKISAGYRAAELGSPLADQFELLAYGQDNERQLRFGIGPFPIGPTATLEFDNLNTTDIRTYGGRAEARKLAAPDVLLTYGVDVWRDRAVGTDDNLSITRGFGPMPIESVDNRPQLPDATYLSVGAFIQGEVEIDRLSIVAGTRYQRVRASTFETTGLEGQDPITINDDSSFLPWDGDFVGSVNTVFRVDESLSIVGTAGRGFRSPNLIERFFDGPTPEGGGYQVRNAELKPETSLNFDLGARYRRGRMALELFGFRNKIRDGIRIIPLGTVVNGQDAFTNTNIDELLYRGVELGVEADVGSGVSVVGSYTWTDTEDVNDVDNPVGESFSNKVTGGVRYDDAAGRFWSIAEARRNGDQKEPAFGAGNPVGEIMPAFVVVDVRGGVRVWRSDSGLETRLNVALTNLTNTLYAEFGNVGFFRPEPKRSLTVSWDFVF